MREVFLFFEAFYTSCRLRKRNQVTLSAKIVRQYECVSRVYLYCLLILIIYSGIYIIPILYININEAIL